MEVKRLKSAFDIDLELSDLNIYLGRLVQDYNQACMSWAYWEVLNGFPTKERSSNLFALANANQEGHILSHHRHLAVVNTLLSLGRMMDAVGQGRGQDRISLDRVRILIENEKLEQFLLGEIVDEAICRRTGVSKAKTLVLLNCLKFLLSTDHPHGLKCSRAKLKVFRDNWFAHSLSNPPKSHEINANFFRHCMVLCGLTLQMSRLALFGTNWSARWIWRNAIKDAKAFWKRVESGYRSE